MPKKSKRVEAGKRFLKKGKGHRGAARINSPGTPVLGHQVVIIHDQELGRANQKNIWGNAGRQPMWETTKQKKNIDGLAKGGGGNCPSPVEGEEAGIEYCRDGGNGVRMP